MSNELVDLATGFFKKGIDELSALERGVLDRFITRNRVSRNVDKEFHSSLTFGQRVADRVASFGGSWTFIIIFATVLAFWVFLNTIVLARLDDVFDPYPYILLNLFLSMLAAIQAPILMMSQNRQAARDRLEATHDYEVNLKAELEILGLHEKIDELRERQWNELLSIQERQVVLIEKLLCRQGIDPNTNPPTSDVR
jgi:uncharacterized membrane protein